MLPKNQVFDQFSPINGTEENSFARFTIQNRLPKILQQIVENNHFDSQISTGLLSLIDHILYEKIQHLLTNGEDIAQWEKWTEPYLGRSWFEVPFYFAETYFYRLILDKINYFKNRMDPFLKVKKDDIKENNSQFSEIASNLHQFYHKEQEKDSIIKFLLQLSLWGNKSDLSQLKLDRKSGNEMINSYTIMDDTPTMSYLFSKPLERVDIILDNSGLELFTDLVLADQLISQHLVKRVILHAKAYPTFVSDATREDIHHLLDYLKYNGSLYLQKFVEHVEALIESKAISIEANDFWNSPLYYYEWPNELKIEFERSSLIIFKGDANYRRIFGDRVIPTDTGIEKLNHYLLTRSLAIRILKSEIMVGLHKDVVVSLNRTDESWMSNGRYGIFQRIK